MVTINNLITIESLLAFLSGILLMVLIFIIYFGIKYSSKKDKLKLPELTELIKSTKENIEISNNNLIKLETFFNDITDGK